MIFTVLSQVSPSVRDVRIFIDRKREEEFFEFDAPRIYGQIWTPGTYFVNELVRFASDGYIWKKPTSKHFITRPNYRMRLQKDGYFVFIQRYIIHTGHFQFFSEWTGIISVL